MRQFLELLEEYVDKQRYIPRHQTKKMHELHTTVTSERAETVDGYYTGTKFSSNIKRGVFNRHRTRSFEGSEWCGVGDIHLMRPGG